MKFGQLMECNMRFQIVTFFLKNHTENEMEKLVPDPFPKN